MFDSQNKPRFEKLRALTPIDAVKAWLDGDFGIGDEPALIEAIRKGTGIRVSDDEIIDLIYDAVDEGSDPAECLEKLAKAATAPTFSPVN